MTFHVEVILYLLMLMMVRSKRIEVRVWQPQIDTTEMKEPVRFWELVEWRPVNETSTKVPSTTATTTTTTTTPPPPTTPYVPQTTLPQCDESDPEALVMRMKDSGVYNEIYMAPDFVTASQKFPNLAGSRFMRGKAEYKCDKHCERSSRLVRLVMTGDEANQVPEDTPRTWWDQSKWERPQQRGKRSIREPHDQSNRRGELENRIKSAMRELSEMDDADMDSHSEEDETGENKRSAYDSFFASQLSSHRRAVRSTPTGRNILVENSGTSRDILGTTIALECQEKRGTAGVPKTGYHFCSTCRAVRHLPRSYFPRIINEVICGDETCVRGDGRCAQRFLPFKVLHNQGTSDCPKWRLVSIDIRTCCDCVLHPLSPFVRYLQN